MIDFCVAINGINLKYQVPLFFETLFKNVNVDQFHIHVVEKGIEPAIHRYIQKMKEQSPVPFTIHILNEPLAEEVGPSREQIVWTGGDAGLTCNWMMENCGTNDWMIISHFDIGFNSDFTIPLFAKMNHRTGMVGVHAKGLVAINRIAYNQCFVGFQSMTGFFIVKEDKWRLRHGQDVRCKDTQHRKEHIEGFDVAELLELCIQAKGWETVLFREFDCFHIGAGSGYHDSVKIAQSQKQRTRQQLDRHKIKAIGES